MSPEDAPPQRAAAAGEAPARSENPLDRPAIWWSLIALAAVLRLPRLGRSLWYDEIYYSTHERFATWSQLSDSLPTSIAAPLYRILLFGWVSVFGDADIVVRLPSMLFGLGSIALACGIARRRFGAEIALGTGLWLSLSPAHVWYSQEGTPYAMVLCLTLAAVAAGDRIADRASVGRLVLFAGLFLAAALTHVFAAALLASFAIAALCQRRAVRWRWLATVAVVGALLAGWQWHRAVAGGFRMGQAFLRPFDGFEAWMLPFQWYLHGNCLWSVNPYGANLASLAERPLLLTFQLAACALLVRGGWRALAASGRRFDLPIVAHLLALPLAVAALGAMGYRHLYIERYLLVGLPFFGMLILRGAWGLGGRRLGIGVAAALLGANLAAYSAWWAKDDTWTVYKQNPDWRSAAAGLLADGAGSRPSTLASATPPDGLRRYLRRLAPDVDLPIVSIGGLQIARTAKSGRTRLYLIENRYWRGGFAAARAALEQNPRVTPEGTLDYRGVTLYRYTLSRRADVDRQPQRPRSPI